jgi:hypothetical protein
LKIRRFDLRIFTNMGGRKDRGFGKWNKEITTMENNNLKEINKQSRTWFFTINAHVGEENTVSAEMVKEAFSALDAEADWVFQMEMGGTTGYEHYQASIFLTRSKPRRRKDIIRVFKEHGIEDAHIEPVQKKEAASRYCSKSDTRIAGPWWSSETFRTSVIGKGASGQGRRTDLAALRKAIHEGKTPDDLMLDDRLSPMMASASVMRYVDRLFVAENAQRWSREQREVQVHYVWGKTGVGKTRIVYEEYLPSEIYVAHMGARDPFSNYKFQKVLVLDEFRSQTPISDILQMLDRYPYEVDRRYEDTWAAWREVFILSNWPLENQYPSAPDDDRAALERRITDVLHMTCPDDWALAQF